MIAEKRLKVCSEGSIILNQIKPMNPIFLYKFPDAWAVVTEKQDFCMLGTDNIVTATPL